MVQAAGTSDSLIKSVTVYEGFAAIERSDAQVPDDIVLTNFIKRRPKIVKRVDASQEGPIGRLKLGIRSLLGE
jgi:hypothetical protein